MPSTMFTAFSFLISTILAAPTSPRSVYPFQRLVAFGDELSDNGNGSYAHGITGGDPASNNYGFGTWTDGPVAVSYLADLLDVPLTDYAFGACCGGASPGATINNKYSPAGAQWHGKPVPSVHQQIKSNYTRSPLSKSISSSLQFIWVGQNDLSTKSDAFWTDDPMNAEFSANISTRITANAELLIAKGAPAVFVANIYPKHLAPVTKTYLCPDGSCVEGWGNTIKNANSAIEKALSKSKYASKIIYYDVFSFMVDVMDNKDSYGITEGLGEYCDGDPAVANWDKCAAGKTVWDGAKKFYWMTFIQPTTTVHELIAKDMKKAVDAHFSK